MSTMLKAVLVVMAVALAALGAIGIVTAPNRVTAILSGTLCGLAIAIAWIVPFALRERNF